MTKYREIIRLTGLGFSQRNIIASCGVSQKTVVKVQKRARELNISWPLDDSMTDTELQRLMFSKESKVSANKRMPDYDYIRKELLRNGVSKKLLWTEYMEDCRANGEEPLMYSQFCYHIPLMDSELIYGQIPWAIVTFLQAGFKGSQRLIHSAITAVNPPCLPTTVTICLSVK